MNRSTKNKGFTLVELLIIMATVVILGGAGYGTYHHLHSTARSSSSNSNVTLHNSTSTSSNNGGTKNFTGIYGIVTLGGCAGAQRATGPNNCFSAPQADMIVTATDYSNNKTFSALTDSKGSYHLVAVPGNYTVMAHSSKQNVIAECQDSAGVIVKQNVSTKLNIGCDNGLR